jgi:hypothetical protein
MEYGPSERVRISLGRLKLLSSGGAFMPTQPVDMAAVVNLGNQMTLGFVKASSTCWCSAGWITLVPLSSMSL